MTSRTIKCVEACQGVPDKFLDRGAAGVLDWLGKKPGRTREFTLDSPLSLLEILRKLPIDRTYSTLRRWADVGRKMGGEMVRLETQLINGRVHTTLRKYHEFVLRGDPASISLLDENYQHGNRLYMAHCRHCTQFRMFTTTLSPEHTLVREFGWELNSRFVVEPEQAGWRCNDCVEKTNGT